MIIREEPVQPVRHRPEQNRIKPPRFLVSVQHRHCSDIETEPRRLDNPLGQHRHITQADIQPLPRYRMHHMRRIPDKREPLPDKPPRNPEIQRIGPRTTEQRQGPQFEPRPPLDLLDQRHIRTIKQRDDPILRLGPDQRTAISRQRQPRKRPCRQKMLFRLTVMRPLMADRHDNSRLLVRPLIETDPGKLANGRLPAIAPDQQTRLHLVTARKHHRDRRPIRLESLHSVGNQLHTGLIRSK